MTIVALTFVLGVAGTAPAQTPPPSSEIDQYVPDLPEAGGEVPIPDVTDKLGPGKGGAGEDGGAISPETLAELQSLGPEGAALGAVAAATAPDDAVRREATGGQDESDSGAGVIATDGESWIASLLNSLGGSGSGLGVMLPLALVLTLAAGMAYVWRRQRV